jgi:hypothetical protein
MAVAALLRNIGILVFNHLSSDFDESWYTTSENYAESEKHTSGSVPSFSNLATAASSKVIELPVFSQLWLELDDFWGTNHEVHAEFQEHKSRKALSCCLLPFCHPTAMKIGTQLKKNMQSLKSAKATDCGISPRQLPLPS